MRELKPDKEFGEGADDQKAMEMWRTQAVDFLAETPPEEMTVAAKYFRKASYDFLCALHASISAFFDGGLTRFRASGERSEALPPPPSASTSCASLLIREA